MEKIPENNFFDSSTREFLKKYGLQKIQYSFFDKFRFIITAGLGLISALAWDETLRAIFNDWFPEMSHGLSSLLYATSLTILATIVGLVLGLISKKSKNKKD